MSGRMTPTLTPAGGLATGLGDVVGGALADDAGGLVSLQRALTPSLLPLELLPLLLLPFEEQAARVRTTAEPTAASEDVEMRMACAFPAGGIATGNGEPRKVGCGRNVFPSHPAQQGIHSHFAGSATVSADRATERDESALRRP